MVSWMAALTLASRELRPSLLLAPAKQPLLSPQPPRTRVSGSLGTLLLVDVLGERGGRADSPHVVTGCASQAGQLGYRRQKSFWTGSHFSSWNSLPSCP